MTTGYSSDEVDDAVQASIVAAGWQPSSSRPGQPLKTDDSAKKSYSHSHVQRTATPSTDAEGVLSRMPQARHLAIDPAAIEASSGLKISLGPVTKDSSNPLFGEDQPWDVAWWNTYPTVAYDTTAEKWKLWYDSRQNCGCKRGLQTCSAANTSNPGMCPHLGYNVSGNVFDGGGPSKATAAVMYAESTDGITFSKPHLGLVDFRGSKANGIVLSTPGTDPGAGVFHDSHEPNASRRFKMFGLFGDTTVPAGSERRGVGTFFSADGIRWGGWASAQSMAVNASPALTADTANNVVWDPNLKKYIAFTRGWCRSHTCNSTEWGERREMRSTADEWGGPWSSAKEVLHGEAGYEMYSLVPFRAPTWTAGLYLAIGSFYATTDKEGHVYCELCRSTD